MDETLTFAAGLLGLWLLFLWQRVPASTLFFSLLVGQILSTEVSGEAYSLLTKSIEVSDYRYVQLGLLLLPVILTLLFLRRKVKRSKFLLEAIPMLFMVSAMAIFAYPHINFIQDVLDDVTNYRVETYKNVIITVASISSLFSAWFTYPGHKGHSRKKH